MSFILTVLTGYLGTVWKKAALFGTIAFLVGITIYGIISYGQSIERDKQAVKEIKVYKNVREKIDNTPVSPTVDSAIERLRESGDIRKR